MVGLEISLEREPELRAVLTPLSERAMLLVFQSPDQEITVRLPSSAVDVMMRAYQLYSQE